MSASNAFTWNSFVTRMRDVDPDLRQMALYDLGKALGSRADFTITDADQKTAVEWVYHCFTDKEKNSEVISTGVSVVGPLCLRLSDLQRQALLIRIAKVVTEGVSAMLTPADLLARRENAAMSLKLTVKAINTAGASVITQTAQVAVEVARLLAAALLPQCTSTRDVRVRSEIFDVLSDLAAAYGSQLAPVHDVIITVCITETHVNTPSRHRAIACLSKTAPLVSSQLLSKVTFALTEGVNSKDVSTKRKYVEVCNAVCRTSAHRFDVSTVSTIVKSFLAELDALAALPEDSRESEVADETRERILCALESFITHCSGLIGQQFEGVLLAVAAHLKWDPNYCADDNEDDVDAEQDFDDDFVDMDDGDNSWKVRISAARCLAKAAAISSHVDIVVSAVASRLTERVDQVRLVVLEALMKLFEASRAEAAASRHDSGDDEEAEQSAPSTVAQSILRNKDVIVKKLFLSAQHKDLKVKLQTAVALNELFSLFGAELEAYVDAALRVAAALLEADPRLQLPGLRSESLLLVQSLVANVLVLPSDRAESSRSIVLTDVAPRVLVALNDKYFKSVLVALKVCEALLPFARENPAFSDQLFSAVYARLLKQESDLDVKKLTIETSKAIIEAVHQNLASHESSILSVVEHYTSLIANEATRVVACKALAAVAVVPYLSADRVAAAVTAAAVLLDKMDRTVRDGALGTLTAFATHHLPKFPTPIIEKIFNDLTSSSSTAAFLSDKDLFVSSRALGLLEVVVRCGGTAHLKAPEQLVTSIAKLLASPSVQGATLEKSVATLSQLSIVVPSTADAVLARLLAALTEPNSFTSGPSLAIGAVIGSIASVKGYEAATAKLELLRSLPAHLFTLCVGSCGLFIQLPPAAMAHLTEVDPKALNTLQDDASSAIAIGVGRSASSLKNSGILRALLSKLENATDDALLHTVRCVKEAIIVAVSDSSSLLMQQDVAVATVRALLQVAMRIEDGIIADYVSDAIGRLTSLHITTLLHIVAEAASHKLSVAAVVVGAVKLVTPRTREEIHLMRTLLQRLLSPDIFKREGSAALRKSCVLLLHDTLLKRPSMVPVSAFESLAKELVTDKTLVREVDLGPFKHRVDHGVELRKIAFECLHALLDGGKKPQLASSLSQLLSLASQEFWAELMKNIAAASGAPDEVELEVSCSAMMAVVKLCQLRPEVIVQNQSNVAEIAKKINTLITSKPKEGYEAEKHTDATRIAIACILALEPHVQSNEMIVQALKAADAVPERRREASILLEGR